MVGLVRLASYCVLVLVYGFVHWSVLVKVVLDVDQVDQRDDPRDDQRGDQWPVDPVRMD